MPLSAIFLPRVKVLKLCSIYPKICTCQISYRSHIFAFLYKLLAINFYKYTIKCDVIQLKYVAVSYEDTLNIKWRINELQHRGRGSGVLEFLGSGNCVDVPFVTFTLCSVRDRIL